MKFPFTGKYFHRIPDCHYAHLAGLATIYNRFFFHDFIPWDIVAQRYKIE